MSELSNTLKALMMNLKITVTELARQAGVGQPVVHRMVTGETGNPKVESLRNIAKFFNVNISQLIGDEPLPVDRFAGDHNPYYRSWNKLPLLSWEQASQWPNHEPSDIQTYIWTDSNVSDSAFATFVEDQTMAPRYPEKTILVVEPTVKAQDGDFALVHVNGQKRAQFKQIMFDNDDLYLKPLNQDFEINRVNEGFRMLGVIVQSMTEQYQDRIPPRKVGTLSEKPAVKKRRESQLEEL